MLPHAPAGAVREAGWAIDPSRIPSLVAPDESDTRALARLGETLRRLLPDRRMEFVPFESYVLRSLGSGVDAGGPPVGPECLLLRDGVEIERERLEQLATGELEMLAALGVLAVDGTMVRARLLLEQIDGVIVMRDRPEWAADPLVVQGLTNPATLLAYLTPRERCRDTLDLGCGNGLQALLAARHSNRVVAVDVNDRAVRMTRLAATLNDLPHVEVRRGSWLDPVEGDQFDLVVSNPPYVETPLHDLVYLRGDHLGGEGVCRHLTRELPRVMRRGATGVVLVNWGIRPGDEWASEPLRWLEGSEVDALIVGYQAVELERYAWEVTVAASGGPRAEDLDLARWRDHFARLGVEAMGEGVVALRRARAGRSARHSAQWATHEPGADAGTHLSRILDGLDALAGHPLETTSSAVPHFEGSHVVTQELTFDANEYHDAAVRYDVPSGVGITVDVAPDTLASLLAIDGQRSIADLAGASEPSSIAGNSPEPVTTTTSGGVVAAIAALVAAGVVVVEPR